MDRIFLIFLLAGGFPATVMAQNCIAFIDALITSPVGTHQRSGRVFINLRGDCFAAAGPDNPIYIRVGFDRPVRLSETLVDPLAEGDIAQPIDLAARMGIFFEPEAINNVPEDAISIVRWRCGETAFWLKISSSSSTWVKNGTNQPPSLTNEIEFYFGLSAWETFGFMSHPSFRENMPTNRRRGGGPVSNFILLDISESGLMVGDPEVSHLNCEIQAMDASTVGVTTALAEEEIQFGTFLAAITFPKLQFPRVCMVTREGDFVNILTEERFPDKNFRDWIMEEFTFLTEEFALAQTALDISPGVAFPLDLPIADLAGLEHFQNLASLSCRREPVASIPDLSGLEQLTHLQLEENRLAALPNLPEGLRQVRMVNNPLRELGGLTAVDGLGRAEEDLIILDNNLLTTANCPDLLQLQTRVDSSGGTLSYEDQGATYELPASAEIWPASDIRRFVEDVPYSLSCP